jgi:hypothetical protein
LCLAYPNLRFGGSVPFYESSAQTKISQTDCTVCCPEYYDWNGGEMVLARRGELQLLTVLRFQIPMEHNGLRVRRGPARRTSPSAVMSNTNVTKVRCYQEKRKTGVIYRFPVTIPLEQNGLGLGPGMAVRKSSTSCAATPRTSCLGGCLQRTRSAAAS